MAFTPNIPYDQILKPGTPVFFYSIKRLCCVGGFVESFRVFRDGSIKYKVGRSICTRDEIKLTYDEVVHPEYGPGYDGDPDYVTVRNQDEE